MATFLFYHKTEFNIQVKPDVSEIIVLGERNEALCQGGRDENFPLCTGVVSQAEPKQAPFSSVSFIGWLLELI